ncbi:unnamed protein product [Didymodactylos carnosus]|uniref:SEC7 domain-containing protein n=1 Tax=Didymodactylos carnosus TaxID=1234261 RepID=A0A814BHP5_9BILA|nr:unnamed protein product [Didymodactylos carnosus]CAF3705261.1 unnamed protein product [Didymodactylos carnosus]
MDQFLSKRLDCPPPSTKTLMEEKDSIIKKQQDEINKLQLQMNKIQQERDYFAALFNTQHSHNNNSNSKSKSNQNGEEGEENLTNGFQKMITPPSECSLTSSTLTHMPKQKSLCTDSLQKQSQALKLHHHHSPQKHSMVHFDKTALNSLGLTTATMKKNPISFSSKSHYELSQDLQDKQIEMLQRKYGGVLRTKRAASVIQRAFRQYKLEKNFRLICETAKANKRISRTFSEQQHPLCSFYQEKIPTPPALKPCLRMRKSDTTTPIHNEKGNDSSSSSSSNTPTNEHFIDKKIDLPSINFEHFIETNEKPQQQLEHQHDKSSRKPTKRVLIVTENDRNMLEALIKKEANNEDVENSVRLRALSSKTRLIFGKEQNDSDFVDEQLSSIVLVESATEDASKRQMPSSIDWCKNTSHYNFYKDLTSSPLECRKFSSRVETKPQPPMRNSTTKISTVKNPNGTKMTRPSFSPCVASPIWKRKVTLDVDNGRLSNLSETSDSSDLLESPSLSITPFSQSSTTSSDRDNMSLQSNSSTNDSYSNSSYSHRNSATSLESQPSSIQQISTKSVQMNHNGTETRNLPIDPVLEGQERILAIKANETYRRRCYRAGLNVFNKKPERGILYLINNHFLEPNPQAVARFLLTRKGLSRQMIGEYLGNLQDHFAMQVLHAFAAEMDFQDQPIDMALRKFQSSFRLPGEAQKIEQLMKVFGQRYYQTTLSNTQFRSPDTIFILAFAIIMLNTDLHSRNIKSDKKMKLEQFIRNLKGIDDGEDLDPIYLKDIYERIKAKEFRSDSDHVTQCAKFEQTLIGKKPSLVAPHRRLVCYCRFYEIHDLTKRERLTAHQREVFLFNDLLVITKISNKKRNQIQYTFRNSFRLSGMNLYLFETPYYQHGIRLVRKPDTNQTNLITFNARNEHDRAKFCEDLKEAIMEMDEMESLRIQSELDKLRLSCSPIIRGDLNGTISSNVIHSIVDSKRNNLRPLSRTLSNSMLDIINTNNNSTLCKVVHTFSL